MKPLEPPCLEEHGQEYLAAGAVVSARGAMAEAALALEVALEPAAQSWSNNDKDDTNNNGNHLSPRCCVYSHLSQEFCIDGVS